MSTNDCSSRQHLVPQFHLRGFRSRPGEGLIFQLDRSTGRWRERSIKDCAAKRGYYDPRIDADTQKLESDAARALRRLANDPLPMRLRPGDRELIANYIVHQFLRVESTRQLVLDVARSTLIEHAEDGHATQPEVAKALQFIEEVRAKEEAAIPVFHLLDGTYNPATGLNQQGLVSEAVRSCRWRVAIAPAHSYFITCDNPAVFYQASPGEGAFSLAGQGRDREISLWFPLSSERGLMIGGAPWQLRKGRAKGMTGGVPWNFAKFEIHDQHLSPEAVVFCNGRTASNAEESLYSARPVPAETLLELMKANAADEPHGRPA